MRRKMKKCQETAARESIDMEKISQVRCLKVYWDTCDLYCPSNVFYFA